MPAHPALLIAERREPSRDMPSDGTQVVYGYVDGSILAGDAHHMWRTSDDPVHSIHPDPDIVWWINAETLRTATSDDHLTALGLARHDLQTLLRDAELGTHARHLHGFGTHHGDDGEQHRADTHAGQQAQTRVRAALQHAPPERPISTSGSDLLELASFAAEHAHDHNRAVDLDPADVATLVQLAARGLGVDPPAPTNVLRRYPWHAPHERPTIP